MNKRLMIYGATGYTGKLLAEVAAQRKLNPILAGRDKAKLEDLSKRLGGLEIRAFSLDDAATISKGLADVGCVIHAAGPFTITGKPMIDACLKQKVHYLDITGEYSIFELAESLSGKAEEAGIMLMPGVGWDVVPSDCIALHASKRVANPQSLRLLLKHFGSISRGSAKSGEYIAASGSKVRRNGKVIDEPKEPIVYDFGSGPENCALFPMGDIVTGWKANRVPNVEVYFSIGPVDAPAMEAVGVDEMPEGPSKAERDSGRSRVFAEVTGADGKKVTSMIETSSGYSYTAESGVEVARRVLAGDFKPGFQGPASAYGADLAVSVGGAKIVDA